MQRKAPAFVTIRFIKTPHVLIKQKDTHGSQTTKRIIIIIQKIKMIVIIINDKSV